jgi:hypothetical protein
MFSDHVTVTLLPEFAVATTSTGAAGMGGVAAVIGDDGCESLLSESTAMTWQ